MIDRFEYSGGLESISPSKFGEIFFPLADLLNDFAEKRLLYVKRYPRDSPSWHFHFLHPDGGTARIQVCAIGKEEISINGVWILNDFEDKRILVKSSEAEKLMKPVESQESLMKRLDCVLRLVLGWRAGEWSYVIDRREIWKAYSSQDELDRALQDLDNLAVPKV